MKTILTILLATLLLSCTADDNAIGNLQIPDKFIGDWVNDDENAFAIVTNNSVEFDFGNGDVILLTEAISVIYDGDADFIADLPNNERLILIFAIRNVNDNSDDKLSIDFYRNNQVFDRLVFDRQ